jgi:hypothetical protein
MLKFSCHSERRKAERRISAEILRRAQDDNYRKVALRALLIWFWISGGTA